MLGGAVALTGLLLAGCGSSHAAGSSNTEVAGQLTQNELAAKGSGSGSATTIPLAKQNSITALFSALSSFQSCLKAQNVTFIGIPNANDPNSPANNPSYKTTLFTCAAQSQILQALSAAQSAQDNLTLAEIKTENQEYLKWRTCMIGKGWTIPKPVPNAKGLLFSFGGTGSSAAGTGGGTGGGSGGGLGGMTPPPGQTFFSTSDMQDCASQVLG